MTKSAYISEREDQSLLAAIARKEAAALAEFYDHYAPRLYGLALKIVRNQAVAEDVLQEVFLAIWNKAGQFDQQRGNLMGWITILCRNRAIDALRSMKNRSSRSYELNEEILSGKPNGDERSDPLHQLSNNDLEKQVKAALNKLPEEQKSLIFMAYFEGLSQTEISERLKIPLGTVKTRIRAGMGKLREALAGIQQD